MTPLHSSDRRRQSEAQRLATPFAPTFRAAAVAVPSAAATAVRVVAAQPFS